MLLSHGRGFTAFVQCSRIFSRCVHVYSVGRGAPIRSAQVLSINRYNNENGREKIVDLTVIRKHIIAYDRVHLLDYRVDHHHFSSSLTSLHPLSSVHDHHDEQKLQNTNSPQQVHTWGTHKIHGVFRPHIRIYYVTCMVIRAEPNLSLLCNANFRPVHRCFGKRIKLLKRTANRTANPTPKRLLVGGAVICLFI